MYFQFFVMLKLKAFFKEWAHSFDSKYQTMGLGEG
jgi:hypothetical protein